MIVTISEQTINHIGQFIGCDRDRAIQHAHYVKRKLDRETPLAIAKERTDSGYHRLVSYFEVGDPYSPDRTGALDSNETSFCELLILGLDIG